MRSGLDNYPDIAGPLRRAAPGLQARAARAAVEWAVARTGLSDPSIVAAMNGGPRDPVESLADKLVERHYELFRAHDQGLATEDEVTAAFDLALAANAVGYLSRGDLAEAINEAICSAEDWSELRLLLHALLGKE